MPHQVCGVRSAEVAHYERLYGRSNFTEIFQELQCEDARVVDRLGGQKQVSNRLRQFLATAESRDWDYKSLFHEDDTNVVLLQAPFISSSPSQSPGLEQKFPSSNFSALPPLKPNPQTTLATDHNPTGLLRLRGGKPGTLFCQTVSKHSRRTYQKHHYALTRLQKKLHASEQQENALTVRLSQIQSRTESYRIAWRSEQVRVCDPIYGRAPLPESQYQRHQPIGRRDSGTSCSTTNTLIQLAIGAAESAAMYGTPLNQSWQKLLLPLIPTLKPYDLFSDSEHVAMGAANRSHRFSGATLAPSSDHDLDGMETSIPSLSPPNEKTEDHADLGIFDGSQPLAISESVYRAKTELEDLTEALNRHAEPRAELRASHIEQMRARLAAEEASKRQAAARPVQERYDEVAASNSKSRRRLNRSYSTDDIENVRRYNERHMPG